MEGGMDMAQQTTERPYVSVTDTVDGGQVLQFYKGSSGLLVGVARAWDDLTTIDDIKKLAADLAGALTEEMRPSGHHHACESETEELSFDCSEACMKAAAILTRARALGVLP